MTAQSGDAIQLAEMDAATGLANLYDFYGSIIDRIDEAIVGLKGDPMRCEMLLEETDEDLLRAQLFKDGRFLGYLWVFWVKGQTCTAKCAISETLKPWETVGA